MTALGVEDVALMSAVVGRELLLPQDSSRSELELLQEVVHVGTEEPGYRNARNELHPPAEILSRRVHRPPIS